MISATHVDNKHVILYREIEILDGQICYIQKSNIVAKVNHKRRIGMNFIYLGAR